MTMRYVLPLAVASLLAIGPAHSQNLEPEYRNTLRAGINRLGLPEAGGFHYQVQYARHLRNNRFVATVGAGYMNAPNPQYLFGTDLMYSARPTKRVTFDATFAYDFLPSRRHALRFGGGPSVWYREDEKMGAASYRRYTDGTIGNIKIHWQREQGVEVGGFGQLDYEYYLARRATAGLRLALGGMTGHNGAIAVVGATVGYRL